jgi:type IV pilus assembly protein PilE
MHLHRSKQRGFTLIELMVVVAVLGILTSIAYPAYTNYTFRSRIPPALEALSGYQIRMEQRFQDIGRYTGTDICPADTANFDYTCTIAADGLTYTAKAVGRAAVVGVEYQINQSGARSTPSHPKGSKTNCWTIRGGMCDAG